MKSLFQTMIQAISMIQVTKISKQYSLHPIEICETFSIFFSLMSYRMNSLGC